MNNQGAFPNFLRHISHHFVPNLGTIIVVLALLFVTNVRAAGLGSETLFSTISYQGTLATASGIPIDATVGMTFRFYNVQSGGTALWTEAHTGTNAVPVSNGLFNVLLGSITPIPASVWSNSTVYLGVQVDGDSTELLPREMIGAVPISLVSNMAFTVPDGSITSPKLKVQHGVSCLNELTAVSSPGNYDVVTVPDISLEFTVNAQSEILFWVDGMAWTTPGTENGIVNLALDNQYLSNSLVNSTSTKVQGQRIKTVSPGTHVLDLKVSSLNPVTVNLNYQWGWEVCINYIVLGAP
ncbi:MAG: hypothetical protein HY869_24050 [Chloroflexi bacterium]|nr:hypothetical protein [Chloroflexota bacterium]